MFESPRTDKVFTIRPPLDTNVYAPGDVIGVAPIRLAALTRVTGAAAGISKITIIDKDKQRAAFDMVFFSAAPTAVQVDNTAYNPSAADADNCIGVISVVAGDYAANFANQAIATKFFSPPWDLKTVNSLDLWVVLAARGTPTYTAATQLTIKIEVRL